nr:hypothetical protein [uncultured Rhodoferax sp.]
MTMKSWPRKAIDLMLKQHDEMLACIKLARECIAFDRECFEECHTDPKIGQLDDAGIAGMADYDAVLSKIDAAIAKAHTEPQTDECRLHAESGPGVTTAGVTL